MIRGVIARALGARGLRSPGRVSALTGISAEEWRALAVLYPELPPDPGEAARRQRERLFRLAARAFKSGRWAPRLEGEPPAPEPTLYVTAHLGSMQALRYALRARGIPAANVLGPFNLDRTTAIEQDRIFDRNHALDFPHAFPSTSVHRLRSALKRGSLIAAADLPERSGVAARLLGGPTAIDTRPFRLARAARVPCRAAFLTLPGGRWTLTLGPPLPREESAACAAFAAALSAVASRSPLDLDGVVYWNRPRR
jgi:hypothetical protein